ncbi:MAG: DUF692 family protein [Hyphomicrobiales bacterium]|nr:DUF692 family protein [Hyphomicrobiales bacterium]
MAGDLAYGVGLAYRNFYQPQMMSHRDSIDFLEIPTEDYIVRSRRIMSDPTGEILRHVMRTFPCVGHGISLSIGSVEPLDEEILHESRRFLDQYRMPEFSDHLTYHRMDDRDLTVFMSMPFEDAAARWVAHQYNRAKRIIKQPFGLEIVAYAFPVAGSPMSEVEFINRIAEYTDCWFLLDAANLFINAENHGYDPVQYLKDLPGERIQHIHIAGGHYEDGEWLDSHSQPVPPEVLDVLDAALQHTDARAVILERDAVPETFESVLQDLANAREVFLRHRPAQARGDLVDPSTPPWGPTLAAPELALDDLPADIEGIRQYQHALVDCAFDMADGKHKGRSPEEIIAGYDLPEAWKARWGAMTWKSMEKLGDKLAGIREDDQRTASHYRMIELEQWAHMLGSRTLAGG